MNYYSTLIAVAEDCPVSASVVPEPRGGKKTVAVLHYELLVNHPFRLTQEDVLFMTWLQRQPDEVVASEPEPVLREGFFAKEQPCLRTSPLPRKYGFGLLSDSEGRVALCPIESEQYQRLAAGNENVKVVKAMRSSRG